MGLGAGVDPRSELARWGLRLAVAVVVACAIGAAACGCPRPRTCVPSTQACVDDTPSVCNAEGRAFEVSGRPVVRCASIGGVCAMRDGRAFCDRRDGGAP